MTGSIQSEARELLPMFLSARAAMVVLLVTGAPAGALLGGCGEDTRPPPGTVTMREYEFVPKDMSVESGRALTVVNDGEIAHNLTIERRSGARPADVAL